MLLKRGIIVNRENFLFVSSFCAMTALFLSRYLGYLSYMDFIEGLLTGLSTGFFFTALIMRIIGREKI